MVRVVLDGYIPGFQTSSISDPDSSNRKRVIAWNNFMRMWDSMDEYSLAIALA